MMKRSGKWYRKNEADVIRQLGLEPTKNSGSGWIEKEDGQSEALICQLKSTDASSIRVVKQDLDTLQHNAHVSHKLPVFAIQFLQSNEVYVVLKPEVLEEVAQYLQTGVVERHETEFDEVIEHAPAPSPKRTIRSSSSAREAFAEEHQAKYRKKGRSAT